MRPDIVWFGENVYHLDAIHDAVDHCEILLVIGTSGSVWPAAGLVDRARSHGAETVLANVDAPDAPERFDEVILGLASEVVPALVRRILDLDYDPDADWSETSIELQKTTVYIDIETALADGPFNMSAAREDPIRMPGLIPGARCRLRTRARLQCGARGERRVGRFSRLPSLLELVQHPLRVVPRSSRRPAPPPERRDALRGWNFFVQSDWVKSSPPEWTGEIVRLGPRGVPTWPEVVGHIRKSAWDRTRH